MASFAETAEQYRMLVQQSVEAIYLYDPGAQRIREANPAFLNLLGYTAEEARHLSMYDFVVHERASIDGFIEYVLTHGALIVGERVWRRKDGGRVDVHVTTSKIRSQDQDIIFVVAHDITERKRAEAEIRLRTAALETLAQVSSALRRAQTRDEMLPLLAEKIREAIKADGVLLFLCEANKLILAVQHGFGEDRGGQWYLRSNDRFWNLIHAETPMFVSDSAQLAASELRQHVLLGLFVESFAAYALLPLKTGTAIVGALCLTFRLPFDFQKEQRWLLAALADMAAAALQRLNFLETLEQQTLDRARALAALYDIAAVANAALDAPAVLQQSFDRILAAMQSRAGAVHLLDGAGTKLELALQTGLTAEVAQRIATQPAAGGLGGWVLEHNEPLLLPDVVSDPRAMTWGIADAPQIYLGAPLRTKSQRLGVISLFREIGRMFKPEEVALLSSLADHIGVAVENAQLRKRAEQVAVMEERRRLARDLHDSVTQSLYSLTLFTAAAQELIQAGEVERSKQHLAEIAEAARQALKEMRLLIYELQPPTLEREGLAGALRRRLEAVEGRASIKTRLLVEGKIDLPTPLAVELYYIAQEALNNVLKHAAASKVTVRISADRERVELEVLDDGVGFNLEQHDNSGLGLINIRERVKKLNGTIEISAAPGAGTQVKVSAKLPTASKSGEQFHG